MITWGGKQRLESPVMKQQHFYFVGSRQPVNSAVSTLNCFSILLMMLTPGSKFIVFLNHTDFLLLPTSGIH